MPLTVCNGEEECLLQIKASPGCEALQAEPKEQELLSAFILAHCPTDQVQSYLLQL